MRQSFAVLLFGSAAATACVAPPAQLIGGTVVGLSGTVILANNGGDTLALSSNGNFEFSTRATRYDVSVSAQPSGQICTVVDGQGIVAFGPITTVRVSCAADPSAVQNGNADSTADGDTFSVGGTITGLVGSVTLTQGTDVITVTSPQTSFQFPADLLDGARYEISVSQQPFNQTCTLNSPGGTIDGGNVGALILSCQTTLRTISFNVQGATGPVTILNKGTDALYATGDGTYTFPTAMPDGATFNATVLDEPVGQACVVDNGYGALKGSNITGINVNCQNPVGNYTIGGMAQGITGPVVLNNAGIENQTVSSSGAFSFLSSLTSGSTYNVSVVSQPIGQSCAISTVDSGVVAQSNAGQAWADVDTLQLNCAAAFRVGGAVSGLASGQKVRLVDNGDFSDVVTVTANGSYSFSKRLKTESPFAVRVATEPSTQSCVVSSGASGIINDAAVTGANVTCTTTSASQYTVGGSIVGLNGNITLSNAGIESTSVSANGNASFTFPTAMVSGSPYHVAVASAPADQFCYITSGASTISNHNITNVAVRCVSASALSVSVAGLNGTMAIENSLGATTIVTGNGTTTLLGVFDRNAYITLTVATSPVHQRCVMSLGSGTINSGSLAPVVRCGPWYGFVDGQNANVVIGQPDLLSGSCGLTLDVNAGSVCHPYGKAFLNVTGDLIVSDAAHNRVLGFAGLPASNAHQADFVLGQSSVTSVNAQSASTGLSQPSALSGDNNHLVLADTNNNRVLIYVPQPTANNQAANVVVGQPSFATSTSACTATGMNAPQGAFVVAGKLIVADTDNNRVLIYNTMPTSNNQAADVVLGQPNMTTCLSNTSSPAANTLSSPTDVWSDGTSLLIADSYNHRVLIFPTFPTSNGQMAAMALGQPDLTHNISAVGSAGLKTPTGVTSNGMQVFVADSGNNRVVVWNALPSIVANGFSGQTFDHVLGQTHPDLSYCNGLGNIVGPATLCRPSGVSMYSSHLIVTDTSNSRYVIYEGF